MHCIDTRNYFNKRKAILYSLCMTEHDSLHLREGIADLKKKSDSRENARASFIYILNSFLKSYRISYRIDIFVKGDFFHQSEVF